MKLSQFWVNALVANKNELTFTQAFRIDFLRGESAPERRPVVLVLLREEVHWISPSFSNSFKFALLLASSPLFIELRYSPRAIRLLSSLSAGSFHSWKDNELFRLSEMKARLLMYKLCEEKQIDSLLDSRKNGTQFHCLSPSSDFSTEDLLIHLINAYFLFDFSYIMKKNLQARLFRWKLANKLVTIGRFGKNCIWKCSIILFRLDCHYSSNAWDLSPKHHQTFLHIWQSVLTFESEPRERLEGEDEL